MKKILFSMLIIASCFGVANAQLIVDENGRTGVGIETNDTLISELSINGTGHANATVSIDTPKDAVYSLYIYGKAMENKLYHGIRANISALFNTRSVYGFHSSITSGSDCYATVGVYGKSGVSLNKRNYGIVGILNGISSSENNYYGSAILGNSTNTILPTIEGRYAGYFYGDTRVTGTLTAGAVVTSSDYRLKENVRSLSSTDGCLGKLMSMNVVEFNNKQREYEVSKSELDEEEQMEAELQEQDSTIAIMNLHEKSTEVKARWFEEGSPIIKNKHYGLIAQELQKIYPDLVIESQDGYLAINYLEIIPLLIRSVQELKSELDATKGSNAPIQKVQTRSTDEEATDMDAIVTTLYQNTPNPFTESTLIQCDVAEEVIKADLYVYDMNGKQITVYAITERGATNITIEGRSLEAGMYLYALIADGQVIDTKRMILTK